MTGTPDEDRWLYPDIKLWNAAIEAAAEYVLMHSFEYVTGGRRSMVVHPEEQADIEHQTLASGIRALMKQPGAARPEGR